MIVNRPSATLTKNARAVTIAPESVTTPVDASARATKNPMSQTDTSPRLIYRQSPTTTTPSERNR